MNKNASGFTIIEIIVVITVIGILSTIGILSFTAVQARSRDSQRSSSATIIAEALEKYYDANGSYPTCATITEAPPTNLTSTVLKGLDPAALITPKATAGTTNSIKCNSTPNINNDVFDYTNYSISGPNLKWTIIYFSEVGQNTKSIVSRHQN